MVQMSYVQRFQQHFPMCSTNVPRKLELRIFDYTMAGPLLNDQSMADGIATERR